LKISPDEYPDNKQKQAKRISTSGVYLTCCKHLAKDGTKPKEVPANHYSGVGPCLRFLLKHAVAGKYQIIQKYGVDVSPLYLYAKGDEKPKYLSVFIAKFQKSKYNIEILFLCVSSR